VECFVRGSGSRTNGGCREGNVVSTAVRKAAWSAAMPADGWSEDLRWYAAAIHQMKLLTPDLDEYRPLAFRVFTLSTIDSLTPEEREENDRALARLDVIIRQWSDPRSLGYQAQVHATFLTRSRWPRHRGRRVLWEECAHGNWFFLPWHRAYLLEFEAVARAHIEALGGPHETWALPYWNSSDYRRIPDAATLPRALRGATLPANVEIAGVEGPPAGRPNPLHEPSRTGPAPLTAPPSAADWPDASTALRRAHYANAEGQNLVSFAGGYLEDLTRFHESDEHGLVDVRPHGGGHTRTGGFMRSFLTAGLDPAFWMHHANVDRLWETYAHPLGHGYPFPDGRPAAGLQRDAFDSWTGRGFRFLRPDGSVKRWSAPEVLDTESIGFRYDTIAPPIFNAVPPPPAEGEINPFGLDVPTFNPLAAADGVRLAGPTTVDLVGPGDVDGTALVAPGQRWIVRFDGIRCRAPAVTSFAVYLDPDGDDSPGTRRLLGMLTLFGVFEASLDRAGNRGSTRLFEATGVVEGLDGFDPFASRLTLVPDVADGDVEAMGLTVERISLEVA